MLQEEGDVISLGHEAVTPCCRLSDRPLAGPRNDHLDLRDHQKNEHASLLAPCISGRCAADSVSLT